MKAQIIKLFITRNGFFNRKELFTLSEMSYRKLIAKIYRKFLKSFRQKKVVLRPEINVLERISSCFEPINLKSRIKAAFVHRRDFKPITTIVIL